MYIKLIGVQTKRISPPQAEPTCVVSVYYLRVAACCYCTGYREPAPSCLVLQYTSTYNLTLKAVLLHFEI